MNKMNDKITIEKAVASREVLSPVTSTMKITRVRLSPEGRRAISANGRRTDAMPDAMPDGHAQGNESAARGNAA